MARAIWTGSLNFGLVNVPVRLFSATEQKDIHFHQFQAGTGKRVRNMRVVEGTHEEVPYEDIVKGYELDDGRYVLLTQEELESVEPGRSRSIEIEDFVDLEEIDPIFFEKTYYLAPPPDAGADKPYALLLEAMRRSARIAVARFVMRGKQYLAAIRPMGDVLALETMYFADEVRDASDLEGLPVDASLSDRELEVATRLIDSLTTTWQPERYRDTYRERVEDLIERKARGETVEVEREAPAEDRVVDLLAALEASLEQRGGRGGGAKAGRKAGRGSRTGRRAGDEAAGRGRRGGAAGGKAGGRAAPSTAELEKLTRPELLDRAREAGVTGRSKMSKAELVEALRSAGELRRAG